MTGKLTGIGVGPGDPELITMKAIRLIQSADVLAYVVDGNGQSHARKTASAYIKAGQNELPLKFSMSLCREERVKSRQEAADLILAVLREGRDVAFITEGDPMIYSSFQYLIARMSADVSIEVCPGISAMNAAASAAVFSLALEDETIIVAPAEAGLGRIDEWLSEESCIVLFKAARCLDRVKDELQASRLKHTAVLVERASTDGQVILRDISEWKSDDAPYFSIVLIRPEVFAGGTD